MSLVIILDNIRSSYNVGSIFRTADGLGVKEIWLVGITPLPITSEVAKTALGAQETICWKYFKSYQGLEYEIKKTKLTLWAIEQTPSSQSLSEVINEVRPSSNLGIVFGNEARGVTREVLGLAQKHVEVPMNGKKKSFNVSVCTAIVSYELLKRMHA